ncbi:MAG: hypothetical protein ACTHJ9_00665 [Rhodanobacter sp.]
MSQAREWYDSETVCEVLDIFYADLDHEPDWAAIRTRLLATNEPLYSVAVELLQAVFTIYEDESAGLARLFASKHGL